MYYKQSLNIRKIIGSFRGLLYCTNVPRNHFTCGHLTRNLSVIPKTENQLNFVLFKSKLRLSVLFAKHKFSLVEQQRLFCVNSPREKSIVRPDYMYFVHILHNIPAYKKYMPPFKTLPVSTPLDIRLFLSESETLLDKTNWNDLSSEEICTIFIKCCSNGGNNNWQTPFINAVMSSLRNISDNLLNEVIIAFCNLPKLTKFKRVFTSLDDEVLTRQHNWDKIQMFYTAFLWHYSLLSRSARSNNNILIVLGNDIHNLNEQEFVLYMLLLGDQRKLPRNVYVLEIEKKLLAILKNISIQEVGIIARGFFKSQTRLCNVKINNAIIVKTIENIKGIENFVVTYIIKLLINYNVLNKHIVNKKILLDALHNEAPSLNHISMMYISLLATRFQAFNPDLLSYIMSKFKENISDLRMKDLEKFCFALSFFNFKPDNSEDFFEALIKDLGSPHRILDLQYYPLQFEKILSYLMHLEIYPHSLITKALQLSPKRIAKHVHSKGLLNLVSLDYAMDIEQPDYQGNRLTESFLQSAIMKDVTDFNIDFSESVSQNNLEKSLSVLLGGDSYMVTTVVLPYKFNLDVIFCTDHDGTPVPIPSKFLNYPKEAIKIPCQSNSQTLLWNAVSQISVFNYSDKLGVYPTGQFVMKTRHMKKLGYNVIEVRGYKKRKILIDDFIYMVKESSLNDTFLDKIKLLETI